MSQRDQKLILVMPPQLGLLKGFSTGLISLANYVSFRLPEVEVEILDLSATSPEGVREAISRTALNADKEIVVGITTTTASYQAALNIARSFKDLAPASTVVFGGHHASADAKTILHNHSAYVDFIIVGEGEKPLVELLINRKSANLFSTPGLAFTRHGRFSQNPVPPPLSTQELDQLSITFRGEGLLGTPGKFDHATYVSARGCPLKCAFCSVANERIRAKSVVRVAEDVRELVARGFTRIAIEDNFFAHSPSRTRELCASLAALREEGLRFSWDCQTRVESLGREGTVRQMEAAGCEAVYIGVESLNGDQLLYLNKVSQPRRYLDSLVNDVVPSLLDSSVDCYINLQFGLPNETDRHASRTFEILRRLGSLAAQRGKRITIFPQLHVVYPGTTHFEVGKVEGRFPGDVFESFTRWESHQAPVLTWLGEHFAHGTGGLPEGLLNPEKLRRAGYEIDPDAVLRVSTALKSIHRLPGVSVFNYGAHLIEHAPAETVSITHAGEYTHASPEGALA